MGMIVMLVSGGRAIVVMVGDLSRALALLMSRPAGRHGMDGVALQR